ncbi:UDP-N-acetylglucosamine 1-carboxyvinyltransferase [Chloracidobacterium validum]|uniref:UDP-N-acetylglucosamine 1-carboxyvinyltransferase n=1 Tax=Chloracidobacterium validum TaxID=2821543 RepID=A0ABX8B715_9BACT|nr:UDP-N-acetylglucosamine 1-carboxyvinyltransferase [Chloracidobacterium validum]QUW02754.1 UDP-N-acetylglucosamine 1-carboxyvinyltransferase [Chloracidobacterium validum]
MPTRYDIAGGRPLQGTLRVSGAKNAALKMIVAALIADGVTTLHNVPRITDVEITLKLCEELGARYAWRDETTVEIDARHVCNPVIPLKYSGSTRTPILFVSPLLHRLGRAELTTIGGCSIGPRPINYHIAGLRQLGVRVEESSRTAYQFHADQLHGNIITLEYPSVGATENLLMASVGARGRTVIRNAAIEPEILNLAGMLQAMGAVVYQDVNRTWIVEGASRFRAVEYEVMDDRIEAASFAACAVATGGEVFISGAVQRDLVTFLDWLRKVGGEFDILPTGIRFYRDGKLRPVNLETDVHPGFMTDWQPPFVVLLTQAEGISVVHETVYESRFGYVEALVSMGAHIQLTNDCLGSRECRFTNKNYLHSALISGPTPLRGSVLHIPDLRAGFAYVMAALMATGESQIYGTEFVQRGYADLIGKLRSVGAEIVETPVEVMETS